MLVALEAFVRPEPDLLAVLLGNPQQQADHVHRQPDGELLLDVEAAALQVARDRLISEGQMGLLFKVMGLAGPGWPGGAGFSG